MVQNTLISAIVFCVCVLKEMDIEQMDLISSFVWFGEVDCLDGVAGAVVSAGAVHFGKVAPK